MKPKKRRDEEFRKEVAEHYGEGILFADDHDNAIIGVISRCGQDPFLVYDIKKVVKNFQKDGMTYDEAVEWIDFNWNAWLGTSTPGILENIEW